MVEPPMPSGMLGLLAVVRFLAELGLLVALGYAGYRLGDETIRLAVVLAALLPLWGTALCAAFLVSSPVGRKGF